MSNMTSDEAFTKWYCDYAEEACREYGGMSSYPQDNCETGWNAALEWAKRGQEPVALEKLFAELLKGTYSGKESYYNDEQISDACYAKGFEIALVAKKKGIELYAHPAPAQPDQTQKLFGVLQRRTPDPLHRMNFDELLEELVEMLDEKQAQPAVVQQLVEALEDLMSLQNGPPLLKWADEWKDSMLKAHAAIKVAKGE